MNAISILAFSYFASQRFTFHLDKNHLDFLPVSTNIEVSILPLHFNSTKCLETSALNKKWNRKCVNKSELSSIYYRPNRSVMCLYWDFFCDVLFLLRIPFFSCPLYVVGFFSFTCNVIVWRVVCLSLVVVGFRVIFFTLSVHSLLHKKIFHVSHFF